MSVVVLVGVGLLIGAGVTHSDKTTGIKAQAKVTACTGSDARYGGGVDCTGTWVTGGALVGGHGHVVVGDISGAGYDDVGHTIAVRLHGGSAYTTGIGVSIILGVIGLVIILLAGWVILAILTGKASRRARRAST